MGLEPDSYEVQGDCLEDQTRQIPEGYRAATIDGVHRTGDHLIIEYGGRLFGGILPELLAEGVETLIVPSAQIIVRHHTADSGRPNQVVHMLIWHPAGDGWVDLYADWE